MTAVLERPTARQMGVAVLLVYGLLIPVPRDGQPGFRLTVHADGDVLVEPVGFGDARAAAESLMAQCLQVGLIVAPLTAPRFVVRRRPTTEEV